MHIILEWVRLGKILEESSSNGVKIDQALCDKFQKTGEVGGQGEAVRDQP